MLTLTLLLLTTPAPAQLEVQESRQWADTTATAAGIVRELRTASPSPAAGSGGRSYGATLRWENDSGTEYWIGDGVAVGDHGALVLAGMKLNDAGHRLYPGTTWQHVLDARSDSKTTKVDVADHAATAAAMSVFWNEATQQFEPLLEVYTDTADTHPAWSFAFPTSDNYYSAGQGVCISDDGETILAWFGYPSGGTKLKAFRKDGTLISERGLGVISGAAIPNEITLSDDGRLACVLLSDQIKLYDVMTGTVVHREKIRDHGLYSMFSGAELCGDGTRFAVGGYGMVLVFDETAPGTWSLTTELRFADTDFCGPLSMSQDGSRVGYVVQMGSADAFEVRLHDLAAGVELSRHTLSEPNTTAQLWASDLDLDDAGETVAVASWGDSLHTTPEGLVLDVAGAVLSEYRMDGSAFAVDLDPTGQVVAFASKNVHANHFGGGGDILCGDVRPADLRLEGFPTRGGQLDLRIPVVADWAVVAVADQLGASPTPYGVSQLDLGATLRQTAPLPIPAGGLWEPILIPWTPQLSDRLLHFQAALFGGGTGHLSNRVSVRVLP